MGRECCGASGHSAASGHVATWLVLLSLAMMVGSHRGLKRVVMLCVLAHRDQAKVGNAGARKQSLQLLATAQKHLRSRKPGPARQGPRWNDPSPRQILALQVGIVNQQCQGFCRLLLRVIRAVAELSRTCSSGDNFPHDVRFSRLDLNCPQWTGTMPSPHAPAFSGIPTSSNCGDCLGSEGGVPRRTQSSRCEGRRVKSKISDARIAAYPGVLGGVRRGGAGRSQCDGRSTSRPRARSKRMLPLPEAPTFRTAPVPGRSRRSSPVGGGAASCRLGVHPHKGC
jgi:hypothetical protein